MECSEVREALSAWADGERGPDAGREEPNVEAAVRAHVAGCSGCAEFEEAMRGLVELSGLVAQEPVPDLAGSVLARRRRRGESRVFVLRWGIALMGGAELVNALYSFVAHGGQEGHATHESLSFTIAICLGLLLAAYRPALARGYLPVIGTAVGLLLVTAVLDVSGGRTSALDELPHVDLLTGCVLLWLLAREQPGGPAPAWRGRVRRPRPPTYGGLRVVSRSLVRPARIGLGTAFAAGLVLLAGGPASAHAVLTDSDPAQGAVLTSAPTRVSLTFDESVTTPAGAVRVFAPDGHRVDSGRVTADGPRVSVGLESAARGTYLVSWRVVSDDSHPVSGAFTFSVGAASAAPTAPTVSTDGGVQTALGVARWVGYVGSALLVGGLLFLCVCWPGGWSTRRAPRLVLAGAVLLVLGAVASLLLKGPLDAGLGWSALGRGELLQEVVGTTYGRATLTRGVLGLLLGLLVLGRGRLSARELGVLGGLLGACEAVSFALAGHAVAGDVRLLAILSESVHVLAMSVWLGGLAVLVVGSVWRDDGARRVVLRFSSIALGSVVALLATGLFQAWRQVRSFSALTPTTYGRELTIKVMLVVMVLGVAATTRALLRRRGALSTLRRAVALESLIVLAVLGVTSALVATEPARSAYRPTVAADLSLAGDAVQVSAVPVGDRQSQLHVYVFGADGQLADPAEVRASVTLPERAVGPLPVALGTAGPGHRQALLSVPMVGTWRLAVTVRTSEVDEETGYVELPIR
ncbi:copper resistance protein CopC [Nocardioides sp. CER19]|uniref:copper resistance protein CopC n=1 Tax=Nocardioides sp. CER19 TaxID=3038538 RepID=UPI00244A2506|nr:copper resistance protein CopC [Nocardioides sp. CER19]MDH2416249.1 copper resistance protein CopC [Nocardioides sp. CER19]